MSNKNNYKTSHESKAPSNQAVSIGSALGVAAAAALVYLAAAHQGERTQISNNTSTQEAPKGMHFVTEQIDFGQNDPANGSYSSMWEAAKHIRNMEGKSSKTDLRPIVEDIVNDVKSQNVAPRPEDPAFVESGETITVTYPVPDQPH